MDGLVEPQRVSTRTASAAEIEEVAAAWDRWHRVRDEREQREQVPSVAVWRELAIRRLPDVEGLSVLDCGSARGGFSRSLAEMGADVTAVDLSKVAVELTRRQLGPGRGRSLEADARCLPFPDDTFDVGVCLQTVNHVKPRGQVLSELVRVTKPSGRIVVTASNFLSPLGATRLMLRLLRRRPEEHPPLELALTIPGVLKTLRALDVEIEEIDGDAHAFVVPGFRTVGLGWLKRVPNSRYVAFHICVAGTVRKQKQVGPRRNVR